MSSTAIAAPQPSKAITGRTGNAILGRGDFPRDLSQRADAARNRAPDDRFGSMPARPGRGGHLRLLSPETGAAPVASFIQERA